MSDFAILAVDAKPYGQKIGGILKPFIDWNALFTLIEFSHMRKNFISLAIILGLFFVAGCATDAPLSRAANDPLLRKANVNVRIDASPGKYQRFESGFDFIDKTKPNSADLRATLRATKLQPSQQWGSGITFCVRGTQPSAKTCILFSQTEGGKEFSVRSATYSEDKAVKTVVNIFPPSLNIAEPIDLRIQIEPNLAIFGVNGKEIYRQSFVDNPKIFEFRCSSVVCDIEFYEPLMN